MYETGRINSFSKLWGSNLDRVKAVIASDFYALAPHLAAWDNLAWEAPQRLPTLLPGWVDAFLRHKVKRNERWLCCFAYIGERLVGVLPVIVTPHKRLGSSWFTLSPPSDQYTLSGDVLLAPEDAAVAFRAMVAEVGRQVPNHLSLDLTAVRQGSPVWLALHNGIDGYLVRRGQRSMFAFLDVQGDFESYLDSFGHMSRNLKRFRKKLAMHGQIRTETWKGPSASPAFLTEFLALEASGWKGRAGTALSNKPDAVTFYSTLLGNFAAQGRVEWHVIRVGDRLVAAQMAVRCGTSLVLLKHAFDEDFSDCRPGTLLTELTFREAFSRPEIKEVNTMSDFNANHIWHMSLDDYVDVHLVRRSVSATLLKLPRIAIRSFYENYVRPRIPAALKRVHRRFKRRGDRKPRRAANSRSA
jgi:CelD/BcsL family acetyltransferase involved in cellulose biosynthesis